MKKSKKNKTKSVSKQRLSAGMFIKNRRRSAGFSQIELADLMKISQSKLSKIEKGFYEVGIQEWFRFCKATGEDLQSYQSFMKDG